MNKTEEISALAEPEPNSNERSGDNAAVRRCTRAWQYAYNKEFAKTGNDYEAEKAAIKAYRRALPLLAGHDNIRDFIACVTYASVNGILQQNDAEHYFDAAKIALGVERNEPKSLAGQPKRLGRPPKSGSMQKMN